MKNNLLIFLILISTILSFYDYDVDEWFFIIQPDNIKSITQDSFNIHFLAENGVFSYDLLTEDFFYNVNLSTNLTDDKKYLIHYEKSNDYFFILTKKHIFYKSSVSSYWRERKLSDFNIPSINSIKNIGFNDQYIFIESKNNFRVINSFSMMFEIVDDINSYSNINWIENKVTSLDLTNYYTFGNDKINENYILDETQIEHYVISSMYDKYENLWLGMNSGAIYKVDDSSYELIRINTGPRVNFISTAYNDEQGNWFFMDNHFIRTGNIDLSFEGYILSIWNENNNTWKHIPKNENIIINDITINNIKKIDDFIIFSTFNGLIIYNVEYNEWYHHYNFLSSSNRVVWNVDFYNEQIYLSTSNGIIECNFTIVDNEFKIYHNKIIFKNSEIYDFKIIKNEIFTSTSEGLFSYDITNGEIKIIDNRIYRNIEVFDSYVLASNKSLWYIDDSGRELISNRVKDFNVSDNQNNICSTNYNEIKIINLNRDDEWILPINNIGPNNIIYSVDCDDEWLWFTSDFGVSYFKWGNYEK
tara:strand:- start:21167 stop:22756 length:1590 start_codon:yes stop_codon:yes gene_type:complete